MNHADGNCPFLFHFFYNFSPVKPNSMPKLRMVEICPELAKRTKWNKNPQKKLTPQFMAKKGGLHAQNEFQEDNPHYE